MTEEKLNEHHHRVLSRLLHTYRKFQEHPKVWFVLADFRYIFRNQISRFYLETLVKMKLVKKIVRKGDGRQYYSLLENGNNPS